jgi:hypothetical protein
MKIATTGHAAAALLLSINVLVPLGCSSGSGANRGAQQPEATSGGGVECGPQAPRDISVAGGTNPIQVPDGETPNLCNVHFHEPLEHAGFAPLPPLSGEAGAPVCHEVENGDKVEFHWVYTNCIPPVPPVQGLDNCVCDRRDMVLRVYAQGYLVTDSGGDVAEPANGLVRYPGSTTGTSFNSDKCSPAKVNWAVSPAILPLSKSALAAWCETNPWPNEDHPHGSRDLVTAPEWLAPFTPPPPVDH